MAVTVTESCLQMVKDALHMNYALDTSTASRLNNEIMAGMQYIRSYCGPAAGFEPGEPYAQLLCDYVLRAESGALETFKADFAAELNAGQIDALTDSFAAALGMTPEDRDA